MLATVFDRAEPQPVFLQAASGRHARHRRSISGRQILEATPGSAMFYSSPDRRVGGLFRQVADPGRQRIQIDVGTHCQEGLGVQNTDRFVAALPKSAAGAIGLVGQAGERFLERFHEPAQICQSLAGQGDQLIVRCPIANHFRSDFKRLAVEPGGMNRKPAAQDLFVRPAVDLFGNEADQ